MSLIPLGTLGSPRRAFVDERGLVCPGPRSWTLDWWIGADDRWHHPQEEAAVRQRLMGTAPVVETAMKVPGGDAVHRAWMASGPSGHLVVEVENRSPVPFALTLKFTGKPPAVRLSRPPSDLTDDLMVPVAHRTTVRAVVAMGRARELPDPAALPAAADAVKGWEALLRQGMTVEVPDEPLQRRIDTARAFLLLFDDGDKITPDPWSGTRDKADVAAVLEARRQWGLDVHSSDLRRPRRLPAPEPAPNLEPPPLDRGGDVARFLLAARRLFLEEMPDGSVALLPQGYPVPLGSPLEVHEGPVGYAVRWHGERPALIWESRRPRRLTCPGLDPTWTAEEQRGEALLRPVAAPAGGAATGP